MLKLDLVQTLAFGGLALMAGYALRRLIPPFARLNLPAAVLGGLLVALVLTLARSQGVALIEFDTTLQTPLMMAFFTTVGFGASLSMLRIGGPMVFKFLLLAAAFALAQNLLGVAVAKLFDLPSLFGVLTGSVTLTGGPATGLAFAPQFEQAGITGAAEIAVAMAMAGIVCGALVGAPIATWLIERHGLQAGRGIGKDSALSRLALAVSTAPAAPAAVANAEDDEDFYPLLRNVVAVLAAMWIGSYVSKGFALLGITLPAYIGAMLVAAVLRNIDDRTRWFGLSHRSLESFGAVTLSLFLALALMSLRLWELANLAMPLLVGLALQVLMIALAAAFVFRRMGRDYESAVMSGGFIGFMLGTTANAMAVMRALVERYGPAPRAFLVAPVVGAFFIDFINAILIITALNLLQ